MYIYEGIVGKRTGQSWECITFYVKDNISINLSLHSKVFNVCPNVLQRATSFNEVAIFCIKENSYKFRFENMTRHNSIVRM